jgi:outer membrane protein TolC
MISMRKFLFLILMFVCTPAMAEETLTWEDCLREAAKNHPDLVAASEVVEQSKDNRAIVRSALFPQIDASVGFSTSQSDRSGSSKSASAGFSGSQLIFDGFKTINNAHTATENIKAAREAFHFTSSQVRWRLRTAYIDLLKTQALNNLTQDIYKSRRSNLQLINLRYESGTEHKGALLRAQAQLASAEFDVHQAERELVTAQWELTKELGRHAFTPLLVGGDFIIPDLNENPDLEKLAANHPNVLKSVAQKNAAAYGINAARGEFFPTVSLEGDASKAGTAWPPRDNESGVGLRFSVPLFEGGLKTAELARAKSVYRELAATELSTEDGIVLNLQQSWNAFADAVEDIGVQQKFLTAAQERSKIAQAQYSVGLISFDNWTIIEDDLVRQRKTFLDTQAGALKAQADWIEAKGETLEYEK